MVQRFEYEVVIGKKGARGLTSERLCGMYRLRSRIFNGRNHWGLPTFDGLEIDSFDTENSVYIIFVEKKSDSVFGCWRILPTTNKHMLNTAFHHLVPESVYINSSHIWELSRFAVEKQLTNNSPMLASCITKGLFFVLREFSLNEGVHRFVTVMSPSLYRLLTHNGLSMPRIDKMCTSERRRLGQTACYIDIDDNFHDFIGSFSQFFNLQYSI